jgi:hypothetical protein
LKGAIKMTKEEFNNLELGDMVMIQTNGANRDKLGIVRDIRYDGVEATRVYLEPHKCTFEFCNDRNIKNKDGLNSWNRYGICHSKELVNMKGDYKND